MAHWTLREAEERGHLVPSEGMEVFFGFSGHDAKLLFNVFPLLLCTFLSYDPL